MCDPRLWILLCWPTWNSGTVERMSMMMEARRNRELTMTNTLRWEVKESLPAFHNHNSQSQSRWPTPWAGRKSRVYQHIPITIINRASKSGREAKKSLQQSQSPTPTTLSIQTITKKTWHPDLLLVGLYLYHTQCTICTICDFLPWQPLMSLGPQRVSK